MPSVYECLYKWVNVIDWLGHCCFVKAVGQTCDTWHHQLLLYSLLEECVRFMVVTQDYHDCARAQTNQ